jgi:uncharacterized protein (TIGR02145 family)
MKFSNVMEKKNLLRLWWLVAVGATTVALNSCGNKANPSDDTPASDEGVVINGVKWATHNVDAPGAFAATPEAPGMFYYFNTNIGWSTTDPLINSDGNADARFNHADLQGETWKKIYDPSPAGWRVPALEEIQKLLDAEKVSSKWETRKGVAGRSFTDKSTGNSIFLPAVGFRDDQNFDLDHAGEMGDYWSSTAEDDRSFGFASSLGFGPGGSGIMPGDRFHQASIRPVADEAPLSSNPEGVLIMGVRWATRNVSAPGVFAGKPETPGLFYQWNSKVGWSSNDPLVPSDGESAWDSSWNGNNSNAWEKANNPCPAGWRLPAEHEWKSLFASGSVWRTVNGIDGRQFGTGTNFSGEGDSEDDRSSIFLPAAGNRSYHDGALASASSKGFYWSNTRYGLDEESVYVFGFDDTPQGSGYHWRTSGGLPCRCVAE